MMHRCSAGTFEPLTGHLVPIAVTAGVFLSGDGLSIIGGNGAAIRRWRRRTRFIRAAGVWLSASAPWLIAVCVCVHFHKIASKPRCKVVKGSGCCHEYIGENLCTKIVLKMSSRHDRKCCDNCSRY